MKKATNSKDKGKNSKLLPIMQEHLSKSMNLARIKLMTLLLEALVKAQTVNGCKLTQSGTATVAGKQCYVFKGKKSGTTIEYYIWEGVVMKHVEKDSDGTSSTTAQSIELPTSIDASKFTVPKTAVK